MRPALRALIEYVPGETPPGAMTDAEIRSELDASVDRSDELREEMDERRRIRSEDREIRF